MALDGVFLNAIASELSNTAANARVEKVYQPSKDEIVIMLRTRNSEKNSRLKLLICANANSPRVHFTQLSLENPASPPMFCMLLRKHLSAGRLVSVKQSGLDRVLALEFEAVNELGDLDKIILYIEIMGRHSNVILVNSAGKVIDSIKRISNEISSVRMILPGVTYMPPPPQDKLNLLTCDVSAGKTRFMAEKSVDVAKSLMQTYEGISPLLARELANTALKGQNIEKDRLSDYYKDRIDEVVATLKHDLFNSEYKFTACVDEAIKLRDFTIYDIQQYGVRPVKTHFDTPSLLLDWFYAERDQQSRMKQRANDLLKLLMNTNDRITKKLALQEEKLLECANRETLKVLGDLVNANLYRITRGHDSVTVENFYDPQNVSVTIKLDPRLSPAKNAQKYYNEYKKAQTAETMLLSLMEKSREEMVYIDSVFDAVSRTNGESELLEIREELAQQGYIRYTRGKNRSIKAMPPLQYRSSDGFSILCGRNNKQNDKLTLKTANNNDMWLHTQGIAGSHVVIESEGRPFSDNAITQAAIIAAYNSKGRSSAQVAVDYTLIRYVKKPSGAKPGMVIFTDFSTAFVTPDAALIDSLLS